MGPSFVRWAVALGLALALPGCFHPDKPACAFSCAVAPHTCPAGFVCGLDELCHDPRSTGVCAIQPLDDAGAVVEVGDAGGG